MRPANGLRRRLAEAQVFYLSLLHQLRHGADGVFNGDVRIDAVLVVEVNVVDPQSLERAFAGHAHMLRPAVDAASALAVCTTHESKFGGDIHLVASIANCIANQFLILERAIGIGGIEEIDSQFQCPVNGRDRFCVVSRTIGIAHAHATEP